MRRVLIVVEGQTERAALKQPDVAEQLFRQGVSVHPKVVGKPGHKGGVRSFQAILREICALLQQEPKAKVTTMFDFYAIPLSDWPGYPESAALPPRQAVAHLEAAMATAVTAKMPDLRPGQFVPYLQLFEFEALLFADSAAIARVFGDPTLEGTITSIVADCGGCEAIDSGPLTAPSKRLEALFPGYKKGGGLNAHAPLIFGQIAKNNWPGLLAACPRFAQWLVRLAGG